MILWMNGAFGVGKTTASRRVVEQQDGWRVFDPEFVGYMLSASLKDFEFSDFQDLRPWRDLVPKTLASVAAFTASNLVAPQSVLVEDYWTELRSGLDAVGLEVFHVVLDCRSQVLLDRISDDKDEPSARDWRADHLTRFEAARGWLSSAADLIVDTTEMKPDDVAVAIIAALEQHR